VVPRTKISALPTPGKTNARGRRFVPGPEDTRAALLASARDLFLQSGPTQFSLREVARRVGVSAAAVYRHFENKDALLFAACTQGFERFLAYLVRALGAPTALERLLATGEQYRLFGMENPLDYRFIFMSSAETISQRLGPSSEYRSKDGVPQGLTFRLLIDRVSECMDASVIAKGDPQLVALRIWAHVHGLVSLRLSGHLAALGGDCEYAEFYRASVAGLLRGLAAE
jgi:AcrR family transcriptional regulator